MIRALAMLCMLSPGFCAFAGEDAAAGDATHGDVLYQVALLRSLVQGCYGGIVTAGGLKRHGDTGIGTFEGVNGEMIVLDGTVYQAVADGFEMALSPSTEFQRMELAKDVDEAIHRAETATTGKN